MTKLEAKREDFFDRMKRMGRMEESLL